LAGRLLLEGEAVRLLEAHGGGRLEADPEDLIEVLVQSGALQRRAALYRDASGRWRCRRCGTRDRVDVGPCARCGREACASCTECARLGVARACEAVLYAPGPPASGGVPAAGRQVGAPEQAPAPGGAASGAGSEARP